MHLDHLSIGDETNVGIFGNEVDRLLQGVFQFDELFGRNRRVDQKQENRLLVHLSLLLGLGQNVLNRGVIRGQLKWETLLGDVVCIVGREVVLVLANGTLPRFVSEVNNRVRIEDTLASFACNWLIFNRSDLSHVLQGGVQSSNWQHNSRRADLRVWPIVPREPDTILVLALIEIHIIVNKKL